MSRGFVVLRRKHSPAQRSHTEKRKIVTRDEVAPSAYCRISLGISFTDTYTALTAANRGDVLKGLVVIAEVFVGRE